MKEEEELDEMEFEYLVDQKELKSFEEALLSDDEEENHYRKLDESKTEYLIDSPYPSDSEDDEDGFKFVSVDS